ncbi:MAG: peroxiredoxin-like family protein [Wenzhouxiangellaceae bacterium]|nr:peroxiredoxin-like family protein [Wenzhouxiangellaceae bacterium]
MKPITFALILVALVPLTAAAEIFPSPEQVRPVLPGMSPASFRLLDVDGNAIDVDPTALDAPIVVTFYRGGWCPYCNMHLAELRTAEARLRELGFEVWFVSPDKPALLAAGDHSEFGYQLYSDPDMNAAQAFGIAFRLDDQTHERYLGFGMDLNERSGDDHRALPAPATFIIGADGVVQFGYVNPDYTVRLAPEVLLAAAQSIADNQHRRLKRER